MGPADGYDAVEPTREGLEQLDWVRETVRATPAVLNDTLRQLVTLSTALLGGTLAFINQLPVRHGAKVAACSLLLVAVYAALWGILPNRATLNENLVAVDETKALRAKLVHDKTVCIWVVCTAIGLALLGLLIGMAVGA